MSTICSISGGSGAGKTTLAFKIIHLLRPEADHLAIDWYYRDLRHISMEERKAVNYDHPDSLEVELFAHHLACLKDGQAVEAPTYDFATHTRAEKIVHVQAKQAIVTEGIHLLALEDVRSRCDVSVFIDIPNQIRLDRRIRRDTEERGREADDVVRQWNEFVAPMHDTLVQPSIRFADRVVRHDDDLDQVAAELAKELSGIT